MDGSDDRQKFPEIDRQELSEPAVGKTTAMRSSFPSCCGASWSRRLSEYTLEAASSPGSHWYSGRSPLLAS